MTGAEIAAALIVPFAAGFVVQRALEIADRCWPPASTPRQEQWVRWKPITMSVLSLFIGLCFAYFGKLHLFAQLGNTDLRPCLDTIASGIFISAGTEGFNSLLKFASYQKEASKAKANIAQAHGMEAMASANLARARPEQAQKSSNSG
jgi:hypothetical protein